VFAGFRDTIALGGCSQTLHFMGAACDCLDDVVTHALTLPAELVDGLTETGAGLPILFGSPLAKAPGRIADLLAKL
jgi:hypothetical protein